MRRYNGGARWAIVVHSTWSACASRSDLRGGDPAGAVLRGAGEQPDQQERREQAEQQSVRATEPAEVLVWEMHATLAA